MPGHNVSPRNYVTRFQHGGQEDFFKRNFITFHVYDNPRANYKAFTTQGAYSVGSWKDSFSVFYPTNSIREEISHNYSELEGTFAEIVKAGKSTISGVARAITQVKDWGSKSILFEEPTYFSNTSKRRFDMTIDLYTFDNIQEDVYDVILFFKKYSHAAIAKDEDFIDSTKSYVGLTTIKYPNTFQIRGGVFNNQAVTPWDDKRTHLILLGLTVEYNPDIQLLNKDGFPTQARLTLSFEELQSLFSGDWRAGKKLEPNITTAKSDKEV